MPIPCSLRETKGREETDTFSLLFSPLLNIDINIKAPSQCRRCRRRRHQIDR